MVTALTSPSDWVMRDADAVTVNDVALTVSEACELLPRQRTGVVDVRLANPNDIRDFQFEFALAEAPDLEGVDAALERLIEAGELSIRAIDDFIMRSKRFATASKYQAGLADYLYGVLAREGSAESGLFEDAYGASTYEGKYDQAVGILGHFDRAPAEAICGMVAFHYNQFDRALTKTRSQRVADVSLRLQALLVGDAWLPEDFSTSQHASLDTALSDSVIEQVLAWCALPLDGTATRPFEELGHDFTVHRPADVFKLHLVAAEHWLAAGDLIRAARHAESIRHGRTEVWYPAFQRRLQGGV